MRFFKTQALARGCTANLFQRLAFGKQPYEYIHHFGVKMVPRLVLDVLDGFLSAPGCAVGTVTGDGIPFS